MATRFHTGGGATVLRFDQLAPMLRAIPSLPRPVLARLTERLIERLDEMDPDPDLEDDDSDRCEAGEDHIASGPVMWREFWHGGSRIGDDADAEPAAPGCPYSAS